MSPALPISPAPPAVKGWCPGALRPMRTGDGLLVRLRITGGIVPAVTLAAVARLARRHGNGLVDLSQRANLQIRGVTDETLPGLLKELGALGLLDADPEVEAIRNVIGPPLASLDPATMLDGRAVVRALERGLAADMALKGLPDKFGFLVDDGGRLPLTEVATDVRLSPTAGGVLLAIGGNGRTAAHVAVVSEPDAADAALALARAFLDLRGKLAFPPRRMASLLQDIGAEAIARAAGLPKFTAVQPTRIGPGEPIGCHAGLRVPVLGVGAPFGRLTAEQLETLADVAVEEIRLTPFRAVLLPGVDGSAIPGLAAAGLVTDPDDPVRAVAACPGAPACPSGQVETRSAAFALAAVTPMSSAKGFSLHVSGCSKGCARPEATRAVLVGRDGRFDLVMDGRADGSPVADGLDLAAARDALSRMTPSAHVTIPIPEHGGAVVGYDMNQNDDDMAATVGDTGDGGHAYIRDGAEIYRRSFAIIRREADLARFTPAEEKVAVRIIHASGMVEVAADIAFAPGAVEAAKAALAAGAPILCDAKMVANGVTRARLPAGNEVICTLDHPDVPALAARIGNTRTAAAMDFWRDRIEGSVIAIGNAPTALFRLFELLDQGWPKPAAVIGMPVGFVGAMESKEALITDGRLAYLVVRGRKGGSAMAAAAVNALASERE